MAIKPTLTAADHRTYVATGGRYCPFCGGDDSLENDPGDFGVDDSAINGAAATRTVHCTRCTAKWRDVYTLSALRVVTPPQVVPAAESTVTLWLLEDIIQHKKFLVHAATERDAVMLAFGAKVTKTLYDNNDDNDWLLVQRIPLPAAGTSLPLK